MHGKTGGRGFGEHLIERGVVSAEALKRAREAQRLYGGRLGTNLVETGALSVAELGARLSEHLGVPPPPASWLVERSTEAEQAVSSELIRHYGVVPLRIEKRTLHVAACDPHDAELREALRRASGLDLELWVLPELRVTSLLGKRFGIRRERTVSLSRLAEQARRSREARAPAPATPPEHEARRALGIAPLGEGEELVGKTFFSHLHTEHGTSRGEAGDAVLHASLGSLDDSLFEPIDPPEPAELEASPEAVDPHALSAPTTAPSLDEASRPARAWTLERAIEAAPDRDTLVDRVLELAGVHAEAAALFVVDDGALAAQRALVDGRRSSLRGVRLACQGESCLRDPLASGRAWRGEPGQADEPLLCALGRTGIGELAILPIRLGDLSVALLYADGGRPGLAESSFAALEAIARIASASWERLVLSRGR